jgi:hypothetical protein
MDQLRDMVDDLAQETREKARMFEQQFQRTASPGRRSKSSHRHATNDCDLIKKWSNPNVANSKLLTGGSACFKHLPGAQYCIDAGLHHHHHHAHTVNKRMSSSASVDMTWFHDMERRLKALAHELEKERNACCPDDKAGQLYQIRFAVLSKHLEEMNALQQEKLKQDQERMHQNEKEWEQRAREMAELYAKMLQDDRAQWRKIIEKLQDTYLHDLQELRAHYDTLLSEERNRAPSVVTRTDDELVNSLRRQLADAQTENDRLRRELEDSRLQIEIREGEAKPYVRQRHPRTAAGESAWASGPVNRARLGQVNPIPEKVIPEVTPAMVRVRTAQGADVDPRKYHFVKVDQ